MSQRYTAAGLPAYCTAEGLRVICHDTRRTAARECTVTITPLLLAVL